MFSCFLCEVGGPVDGVEESEHGGEGQQEEDVCLPEVVRGHWNGGEEVPLMLNSSRSLQSLTCYVVRRLFPLVLREWGTLAREESGENVLN